MLILLAAAVISAGQDPVAPPQDCASPANTIEMNDCAAAEVAAEEARMAAYLAASIKVLRDEAESPELAAAVVAELHASQTAWQAYADSACRTVYTRWQSGTIRNLMALGCRERLTRERTHTLWADYLGYMDSTPPILPEPLPLPRNAGD
ncbi:MAG: lysozyme inhibitor LprI family protein [Brevundimonas sp.]|uniref:lysozyme inhibitor LprI family protein n=1 Tax=Brevundimonas sp. TaxID=1871086 RepID=UPI00391B236D